MTGSGSKNGGFNPFTDRLSRDLRNELSRGLLRSLATGHPTPVLTVAAGYRRQAELAPYARDYLAERLACYQVVLASATRKDHNQLALLLWNHELFFEFHELLEKRWMMAAGVEKEILQGLIRAAGCYIHRQSGNNAGARKMAARAQETIKKHRDRLPPGFTAEPLLTGLANAEAPPPRLGPVAPTNRQCRHNQGQMGKQPFP